MSEPGCEICHLLSTPPPEDVVVFSTLHWRVTLAADQIYLGRAYVTAKVHCESLARLTRSEVLDHHQVVARYQRAVSKAFGADLFNWVCLMNDAFKQPEPRPHVHWHVRPRYREAPSVGQNTYPDPNFGHHYQREQKRLVERVELEIIRDAVVAALGE